MTVPQENMAAIEGDSDLSDLNDCFRSMAEQPIFTGNNIIGVSGVARGFYIVPC